MFFVLFVEFQEMKLFGNGESGHGECATLAINLGGSNTKYLLQQKIRL